MDEIVVADVPYFAQKTYETCWLAAYKMMLAWRGNSKDLADRLPNHQTMRRDGILDWQLPVCRKALGMSSSSYTGFTNAGDIGLKLENYGPIWISGFYADGHKHVVVLYGVRGSGSSAQVLINDPQSGMNLSYGDPKPAWWNLSWFAARLNAVPYACQHWLD